MEGYVTDSCSPMKSAVSADDFDYLQILGKGAYGRVWKVRRRVTRDFYAMKIINVAQKVAFCCADV